MVPHGGRQEGPGTKREPLPQEEVVSSRGHGRRREEVAGSWRLELGTSAPAPPYFPEFFLGLLLSHVFTHQDQVAVLHWANQESPQQPPIPLALAMCAPGLHLTASLLPEIALQYILQLHVPASDR